MGVMPNAMDMERRRQQELLRIRRKQMGGANPVSYGSQPVESKTLAPQFPAVPRESWMQSKSSPRTPGFGNAPRESWMQAKVPPVIGELQPGYNPSYNPGDVAKVRALYDKFPDRGDEFNNLDPHQLQQLADEHAHGAGEFMEPDSASRGSYGLGSVSAKVGQVLGGLTPYVEGFAKNPAVSTIVGSMAGKATRAINDKAIPQAESAVGRVAGQAVRKAGDLLSGNRIPRPSENPFPDTNPYVPIQGEIYGPPSQTGAMPGMVGSAAIQNPALTSGQMQRELQSATRERRILAERLGSTYRAAQAAKMAGDNQEYERLMDQWQGMYQDRQANEAYGSDLSAAMPRRFVTPDKAAAGQPILRQQLQGALNANLSDRERELNATPSYEAASTLPDQIRRQRFTSPADQIRLGGLSDFSSQEPTLGPGGELTTPDTIEQRRRAMEMEKIKAERAGVPGKAAAAFPGGVDANAMNERATQQQNRATEAAGRIGPEYQRRQADRQFRQDYAAGEQKAALADVNRRAAGEDLESIERRIALADAQFRLANVERTSKQRTPNAPRQAIDTALPIIEKLAPEVIAGTLSEQFSSPEKRHNKILVAFDDVEASIPSLTPQEKEHYSQILRKIRNSISESRSAFGRTQYADEYTNRIKNILAWIETGSPLPTAQ